MAEKIALYASRPKLAVEAVEPLTINPKCTRCTLSASVKNPCIPASGTAADVGDLLVVGDGPGKDEDVANHAFVGRTGTYLRALVSKLWSGKAVYDNGTRCFAGKELPDAAIESCRPYLKGTLDEVKPKRIISLGPNAHRSFTGRSIQSTSTRRAYAWMGDVPVFFLMHPASGLRNDFVKKMFEEDLKWALTASPPKPPWEQEIQVVSTVEEAELACTELMLTDWFAFDVETAGQMFEKDFRVLSVALSTYDGDRTWCWQGPETLASDSPVFAPLKALLRNRAVKKVGQNVKYDILSFKCAYGFWVEGVHGDTRLWRKLLEPESAADLATMGELVGMGGHKDEADALIAKTVSNLKRQAAAQKKYQAQNANQAMLPGLEPTQPDEIGIIEDKLVGDPVLRAYAALPRDVLIRYNGRDAVVTSLLGGLLEARLRAEPQLHRIWKMVVHPASLAITRVENWGVPCSRDSIFAFQQSLDLRLQDTHKRLAVYGSINWGSPVQLRKFLYETLGLTPPHETNSGLPSTDEAALQLLKAQHAVVGDILDLRFLSKMKGTYADGMLEFVRADGRVHGSIHLDGARSGRTAMSEPNLQNIPRAKDSPEGKMARDCFLAPPGFLFVELDYSQLELRIAAMLSGDEEMAKIFASGVDYHLRTAQLISFVWNKRPEEITEDSPERTAAKAFNFGILYGMSDEGIAARAGITVAEARKVREAIFGRFKRLAAWIKECARETALTGFAWTWWEGQKARRRPLHQVGYRGSDEGSKLQRSKAEHSAWNTPVQGTASEFCIASLVKAVDLIENHGLPAELNLPVHDSLLMLVKEKYAVSVANEVAGEMSNYNTGNVKLVADAKIGPSWGSMQKLKLAA